MTEMEKRRKFHDMWAFILYLVFTTITLGFMVSKMKEPPKNMAEIMLPALAVNVTILLVFMGLVFLAFRFIPEEFIFFANVIAPIIGFVFLLFLQNAIVIVLAAISLAVSLWFYFAYIKPVLPLIAASVRSTSKILSSRVFSCIAVLVLSVSIQVLQVCLLLRVLGEDQENQTALFALFIFNNYWTLFNVVYFTTVLVSSIVIGHVMDENATFGTALHNSAMALGSVSFASLIMAVITTARALVRREMDRERDRREGGLLKIVLLCIAALILAILGDILNTMNELALPYLALHGTSYRESVERSFNLISERKGLTLLNNIAIERVLFFCLIFFIEALLLGDSALLYLNPSISKDMSVIMSMAIIALPSVLFAYEFLSMFSSGSLALIYTYIEAPEAVRKADPELADEMQAFKHL